MKKKWPWIIGGIVLIGIVVAILVSNAQKGQPEGEILRTAEVTRENLDITVSASGNVVGNQKAGLHFETVGTVAAIAVEVGDQVKEGDTLAQLDADALKLALEEAETRLGQAQTDYERQLTEAQLNLESAELRLKQAELRLPGVSSASAGVRSAEAGLKQVEQGASEEAIAIAERQVEQAKNGLWGLQLQRDATCGAVDYGGATKNQCHGAEAAVQEAEESVRIAELKLQETQKGASAEDLETAQAKLAQAQAEYSRARDENQAQIEGLEILEADVERAQIALDRIEEGVDPLLELAVEKAQDSLAAATLKAPFDGIVAAIDLQIGEQASTAVPAITIVDDSVFYVEVTVDETDIGKVAVGQTVEVTLDAYPNTALDGEIETIAPAATTTGGIVSYPVRVRLSPTEDVAVRDGMTTSVLIQTSRLEDALLVPNWAIRTDQDSGATYTYCYCIVEGQPTRTQVTIGERNETYTQILSGLEEGTQVALVTEERTLFPMGGGGSGAQHTTGGPAN